jgi:hypothetical protein
MSSSSNLEALKKKNKALKAELHKLELLASSVDSKKGAEKAEAKIKDVSAIKRAFDYFDSDGSGFIDALEFASLSADLGEVLDDNELSAAVKAIDVSGDGKISFNEFVRWWTAADNAAAAPTAAGAATAAATPAAKSAAKIALLKTKLRAREFKEVIAAPLLRQLSTVKPNDTEFVKHRVAFSIGDFATAKASINAAVSFAPFQASQAVAGMPGTVKFTFALQSGATTAAIETARTQLNAALTAANPLAKTGQEPWRLEFDEKNAANRTMTLTVGVPEDPFAMAATLGLDLSQFIREVSLGLELPFTLTDLLDGKEGAVADLIGLRAELKLQFRKALVHTLAATFPGLKDVAFGAFCENFSFVWGVGSVKELLNGILPPDDLEPAAAASVGIPPPLFGMMRGAKWLLAADSKPRLKAMIDAFLSGARVDVKAVEMLDIAHNVLEQPTSVVYESGSGVVVTVNLKDVIPFKAIPKLAAKETTKAITK